MKILPLTFEAHDLDRLLSATHDDPFAFLGPHQLPDGRWAVRVFEPRAEAVTLHFSDGKKLAADRVNEDGFFEAVFETKDDDFSYKLEKVFRDGTPTTLLSDPYCFGPILGELDLHLFSEGNHHRLWEKLGARACTHHGENGVQGATFAVWAPHARRVSVVGDWNHWDGRVHPMRKLSGSGVWELFLPGLGEGAHYKFEILDAHGARRLKSDPFAFYSQHSQRTASILFDLNRYEWSDDAWMKQRDASDQYTRPMSIYECHLGSWKRVPEDGNRMLTYRELAEDMIPYVKRMGFTHIELMPISEHPFDGSWGYQVGSYFAPTSRHGDPDDFRFFVDRCHQEGIGVILDWVPAHFPKDEHGLVRFDGTHLYEHQDPRQGEHQDWGTLIFNFGRNEVRNFLVANGLFWLREYHIDGLRVDAVASMLYLDYSRKPGQWVPNAHGGRENIEAIYFLRRFNEVAYAEFPGIVTIAEESTSWPGVSRPTYTGGLGFGMKWNMGWMNDTLRYFKNDPVFRRFQQGMLTFSMMYAFTEHFVLPLSHDEVVHLKRALLEKMPGDEWQRFANLRLLYGYMWSHPGRKLLFQGGEFAQLQEWSHSRSLDWHLLQNERHAGVSRLIQHLNHLLVSEPALHAQEDSYDGFEWVDFSDADNSVLSYARLPKKREEKDGDVPEGGDAPVESDGHELVFVLNFTPVVRSNYRLGLPGEGKYVEILNTDSNYYGGSNVGNGGEIQSEPIAWQKHQHSATVTLPPLAVIGLKRLKNPAEQSQIGNS